MTYWRTFPGAEWRGMHLTWEMQLGPIVIAVYRLLFKGRAWPDI
jgi:hypothetical protein